MKRKELIEDENSQKEESSIKEKKNLDEDSGRELTPQESASNQNIEMSEIASSKNVESSKEVKDEKRKIKQKKNIPRREVDGDEVSGDKNEEIKFKSGKRRKKSFSSEDSERASRKTSKDNVDYDVLFPSEELDKIPTIFTLDIIKLADECFDIYQLKVKNRNQGLIDIDEVNDLLNVLGINRNIFEIKNCIFDLKKTKKFIPPYDKYSKENFLDIVEFFRNYRIDDKLLVEAYRSIDYQYDGIMEFRDIKKISIEKKLNFSDEEIHDIMNFFELENVVKCELQNKPYVPQENNFFNFEKFCKLYYQG
jgi:hypothetical protein